MDAAPAPWVSHVLYDGTHMACDLLLHRGGCTITKWSLGFSEDALLARTLCSDHRPLVAHVMLELDFRTDLAPKLTQVGDALPSSHMRYSRRVPDALSRSPHRALRIRYYREATTTIGKPEPRSALRLP